MDSHALVSALKELALQLGRTPTRAEFVASGAGFDYKLRTMFGTYAVLIEAAGLEQNKPSKKTKITNQIFERDIERHLEQYQAKSPLAPDTEPYPSIACISDIHFPFEHQPVLDAFVEYCAKHKPEHIVINGDMYDLFSHSKFPRSHNVFTPKEEHQLARSKAEAFWKRIREASPKSKCYQNLGNHSIRPLKRILETYPAAEEWIEMALAQMLTFDGVETNLGYRKELIIGNVMIIHGYRSQLGAHRDYVLHNVIVGHTHRPGVVFRNVGGRSIFELNAGYAADPNSKGLSYTSQRIVDWVHGFAVVDQYGPRVVVVR